MEEKAKELVDKYLSLFKKTDTCFLDYCCTQPYCQQSNFQCKGWLQFAKESAKIAVNEIINEGNLLANSLLDGYIDSEFNSYWIEVLKEIDNI